MATSVEAYLNVYENRFNMAEFCLDGTNKSLSKSRDSQIYSLFQRSWGAQKNRTPHHDVHYMDIILISLSLAWRASSTKDEERLNLYRMHFSSKCLKKDQHNDVVRPFYHFRPSCDVIIMGTWHILTCALSKIGLNVILGCFLCILSLLLICIDGRAK